ncbi:protein FAM83G-like [Mobula birostris]|uniref:protein FAM83G-like n=1 Tax=Mobula birostris TaxID=1983395 RepID=UPI003B27C983
MALSQLQCLDEGNVNFRTNESKPEFFYSERQRLAVEALVAEGIHAFNETVTKEKLREFLSELDIQQILRSARDFLDEEGAGEEPGPEAKGTPLSLHYWPDSSDVPRPSLDLGWPDCSGYRGVTRANVYTQPPMEGSVHIKEMFRRMISQAQKVIAVVMDIFTDIDIFKDLLDASFKRKVPVYIIHDETNIKYFLKMCQNAGMHMGMLRNLRVFTINGNEFTTRTAKTIVGRQMQKFLLIDGDKAASGSYSFTWTASRLDRNIITVLSGQAVEIFDNQFRELLHFSKPVNLRQLDLAPEEDPPEPLPQAVALTAEQTAAIAKKLINPKYALVRVNNTGSQSSEKKANLKEAGQKQSDVPAKAPKPAEAFIEEQISHPALVNLPKVNMFLYLPTYVEVPQGEQQQQNVKEVQRKPRQQNSAKIRTAKEGVFKEAIRQKKPACENPSQTQAEAPMLKESLVQNHSQAQRGDQDSQSESGLDVISANAVTAPKVMEELEADVDQEEVKLIEVLQRNSTYREEEEEEGGVGEEEEEGEEQVGEGEEEEVGGEEEEEENGIIDSEAVQVDSHASADKLDGKKQVDGVLDGPDREESDEGLVPMCDAGESEYVSRSNKADADQNALPVEYDLINLEDDCPSNPSTNYTPDWNTDSSSPPEQSIASSDSDDFLDCTSALFKRRTTDPMIYQAHNEVAVRKENNFISHGYTERPLTKFGEVPNSLDMPSATENANQLITKL